MTTFTRMKKRKKSDSIFRSYAKLLTHGSGLIKKTTEYIESFNLGMWFPILRWIKKNLFSCTSKQTREVYIGMTSSSESPKHCKSSKIENKIF